MIYAFDVVYREEDGDGLKSIVVRAETPDQAEDMVRGDEGSGITVQSVGPGMPVLDPKQQTFDTQEACAYLHCGVTTLNRYMNSGWLPKFKTGRPVFTREQLDGVLKRATEERAA